MSKIWGKCVNNIFDDQHKLTEIVKFSHWMSFATCAMTKKNDEENSDVLVWLMNVVHSDGIIIEDDE